MSRRAGKGAVGAEASAAGAKRRGRMAGVLATLAARRRQIAKAALVVLVLLVSCIPCVFINNVMGYVLPFSLVFLLVLCRLWLAVCRRGVRVEASEVQAYAVRGETLPLSLRVVNGSPLFVNRLDITFTRRDAVGNVSQLSQEHLTLLPREERTLEYGLYCAHVGSFAIEASQTRVFSPLCLFSASLEVAFSQQVEVEPYLFEVGALGIEWEDDLERDDVLTTRQMDGMDYTGVREYEMGDPMKSIHWKLSARFDEQFTRLYEQTRTPGALLLCDLACSWQPLGEDPGEEAACMYDAVLESLFSLERYAHRNGIDAEVQFVAPGGTRSFDSRSQADYLDIMEDMPAFGTPAPGDFLELLSRSRTAKRGASNVVVVSASPTPQLFNAVAALKEARRNPVLVAVCPSAVAPGSRAQALEGVSLLQALEVPVFAVADTREFEEAGACAL